MKHLKYIFFIPVVALLTFSCSDWLDIQPKTEVKQDKMFESESGFKDALIGAYLLMGETSLYGKELTYTFLENLAQQYELLSSTHPYYTAKLNSYSSPDVETILNNIWIKTYRVIANLNAILENLELKKDLLHPTHYANIKAEAMGLRAFLHFDLLRMFGWGDLVNTPSNLDKLCIPYVTRYHKEMTPQSTVREVLKYIHEDLHTAEELLAYYDVYNQVAQKDDYELPNEDGFYSNRRSRFNYYAARAMQVRVYMWEGKYKEALERVSIFIQQPAKIAWVDLKRAIEDAEPKEQDLSFTAEHIFNLDIYNMYEALKSFIEQYKTNEGFSIIENTNYFYHTKLKANDLFEYKQGVSDNDYRYLYLYDKNDDNHWLFKKFKEVPESNSPAKNKMPLIRKPEMFYYAAECYNRLNDKKKAIECLNEVRTSRGIESTHKLEETLSSLEIDNEIQKEWKKEYIGEGQMFYYYKRLGLNISGAGATGDLLYVLPLPKSEVELGGREDYQKK